jgi:hypothetical protein
VVPAIYSVITAPDIQASIFNKTYLCRYWRYLVNSMSVIMHTRCQIQRTTTSLRNVNCGPGHIQCIYSTPYSDFNIHLKVTALLLEISRQFNVLYAAHSMPNTAHNHQFTQCELRSRTYTMHLQLCIFRLQYSSERISAAIGDISTIQWALYCKHGAKYSSRPPVCAMWTVVPAIYIVITAPHIQASIFNKTLHRCYWRYVDNSPRVILQTWCQYSV